MCQARDSANPQEDCKKHSTRAAGTHSYELPKAPTIRGFLKVWLWDIKHKTAAQHGLGITEEKGEQRANRDLFSCTVLAWN